MFIPILLFVVGLVCLIKGGDWFVDAATAIAHRLHVSELLIGATVVSIGTTLPEVMVSATSAMTGHGEIAYGNAIGSIICNSALIAAITIAIRPTPVDRKTFVTPVIFFFLAAIAYSSVAIIARSFSRLSGIFFLCGFVLYILISIFQASKQTAVAAECPAENSAEAPLWKDILWLVIGAAVIALGAKLLVENATILAKGMGVPESVIALTLVALGTSLPEFVTAITSLVKGHSSLSLGNIIGANLFNIVLVSGLSTTLCPFDLPQSKLLAGYPTSLIIDLPVMFTVMLLMVAPVLLFSRLFRLQGIIMLAIYAAYCAFLFIH